MGASGLIKSGVPPQPLWLLYIKIAIIVLSVVILGLSAWELSLFSGATWLGSAGAGGLLIFVVRVACTAVAEFVTVLGKSLTDPV
jgi:polyferredoxin